MKVFIDTNKLQAENEIENSYEPRNIMESLIWIECRIKAERIGIPVDNIVEKLRAEMKSYKWDEDCDVVSDGKIIGWIKCCEELKQILKEK